VRMVPVVCRCWLEVEWQKEEIVVMNIQRDQLFTLHISNSFFEVKFSFLSVDFRSQPPCAYFTSYVTISNHMSMFYRPPMMCHMMSDHMSHGSLKSFAQWI
jgi:hypothetical protein